MAFVAHVTKASRKGGTTRQGNKIISLGDLYRHNERVGAYGNAENIDKSKTQHNYSLDDFDKSVDYETRLDEVKKRYGITAKERSVAVASMVISGSPEEMGSMSEAEQKQYFADVRDKLSKHFGADTLVYAEVHNDEKTPHMHIGYVPIYQNEAGKNAIRWGDIKKDRETGAKVYRGPIHRDFLKYLQNDLPAELIEKGYKIEIGGKTSTKHVDTAEWREIQKERNHLQESYRERFKKIDDKEAEQKERESVLADREAKLKADEQTQLEKRAKFNDTLMEQQNLLVRNGKKVKQAQQRIDVALKMISEGLGLSAQERDNLVTAKKPQEIYKLINKRVAHTASLNETLNVGRAVEDIGRSGSFTVLDSVSEHRPNIADVTALGIAFKERYTSNPKNLKYKRDKITDAIENATPDDLKKGFEKYVSKFSDKEKTQIHELLNDYADLKATQRIEQRNNQIHATKPREKKAQDMGRSR